MHARRSLHLSRAHTNSLSIFPPPNPRLWLLLETHKLKVQGSVSPFLTERLQVTLDHLQTGSSSRTFSTGSTQVSATDLFDQVHHILASYPGHVGGERRLSPPTWPGYEANHIYVCTDRFGRSSGSPGGGWWNGNLMVTKSIKENMHQEGKEGFLPRHFPVSPTGRKVPSTSHWCSCLEASTTHFST